MPKLRIYDLTLKWGERTGADRQWRVRTDPVAAAGGVRPLNESCPAARWAAAPCWPLRTRRKKLKIVHFHNKGITRYLDRNCHLFQSVCQHFFLVIRTWWVDVEPSIVKYAAPATVRPTWPLWFPSIWRVASHILVSLSLCFAIWGNQPLRTLQLDDEAILRTC